MSGMRIQGFLLFSALATVIALLLAFTGCEDSKDQSNTAPGAVDPASVPGDLPGPIVYRKTVAKIPEGPLSGTLRIYWPEEKLILNPPSMKERANAQAKTVNRFKVFHDFQFTDRLPQRGITFMNRVVQDAGKSFKPVHYDHGGQRTE